MTKKLAFRSVVYPLRDELAHFATRLAGGDAALGEAVVQDALARAEAAWSTFPLLAAPGRHVDVRASARAWMYKIIATVLASHRDRPQRAPRRRRRAARAARRARIVVEVAEQVAPVDIANVN